MTTIIEKFLGIILTEKFLNDTNACNCGIRFVKKQNLIGFPISRLNEIGGDHGGYVSWLKKHYPVSCGYDERGNCVYLDYPDDSWEKREYDENGNCTYTINSNGFVVKKKYDKKGNCVYLINQIQKINLINHVQDGYWEKREYDERGNCVSLIECNKYWRKWEYDERGNCVSSINSSGHQEKYEYDENGNCIYLIDHNGFWVKREYDKKGNCVYLITRDRFGEKREYDKKGNCVLMLSSNGYSLNNAPSASYSYNYEYYPNDQLKRIVSDCNTDVIHTIDEFFIPQF